MPAAHLLLGAQLRPDLLLQQLLGLHPGGDELLPDFGGHHLLGHRPVGQVQGELADLNDGVPAQEAKTPRAKTQIVSGQRAWLWVQMATGAATPAEPGPCWSGRGLGPLQHARGSRAGASGAPTASPLGAAAGPAAPLKLAKELATIL